MTWHVGTALRFREDLEYALPAQGDVLRVGGTSAGPVFALANAYDSGFATNWPAGSRLLLDLLPALDARGPAAAFEHAARRFLNESRELDPSFDEGRPAQPSAALMLAACEGPVVEIAWLGGARAVHVRGGECFAWTTPHTVRAKHAELFPEEATLELHATLTRSIRGSRTTPGRASFALAPGDRLLFVHGASFETELAALAAAASASTPEDAAHAAVATGRGDEVFVAAVAADWHPG